VALNTLGCGRYSAQLWTRGGGSLVFDRLPVTNVTWGRVLDDTSQASVDLAGLGRTQKCFEAIRDAEPGQHELAVIRDGAAVWQGPVFSKEAQGTSGGYDARDLSLWWDHRRLPVDREFLDTDLATIFETLADDSMLEDTSPNITVVSSPTGITGTRKYLAGQHLIAGVQLRELANNGVDFTFVGRDALVGGTSIDAEPIVLLQDRHLASIPKTSRGFPVGNRVGMAGAGGGEGPDPIFGEARDEASIATYGLLDDVQSQESVRDDASAAAQARSTLAIGSVPVTVLSDVVLDSSAPVLIEQLVPGALVGCAFTSSGIEVAGVFRLSKVDVKGAGGNESVTLTLEPVGT